MALKKKSERLRMVGKSYVIDVYHSNQLNEEDVADVIGEALVTTSLMLVKGQAIRVLSVYPYKEVGWSEA